MDQPQPLALIEVAEIKRIITAIEHRANRQLPGSLLITSTLRGEGKTLLAASLGAAVARTGRHRVALIDLHWRRPALHRFFARSLAYDAAEMIDATLSDLIQHSEQTGLDLLTAPKDHAEVSSSGDNLLQKAEQLIDQAKAAFDLVIIDSAPLFPTNRFMMDPIMLTSRVQGVIMVVLQDATPKQQVRKAQKTLESAGANLLGVVSNQGSTKASAA